MIYVTLTATGENPDGDELTYRWWRYFEADTYDDGVAAPKLEDQDVGLVIDRTAAAEEGAVLDSIVLEGADTERDRISPGKSVPSRANA